jgi:hypothetical protein
VNARASGHVRPELDPERDLVGVILDVPDHLWGITTSAPHHPSACTHYEGVTNRGLLVKGTDAENVRAEFRWRYYFILPDGENNLDLQTAFECAAPRFFKRHRLRILLADRRRGRLSDDDLEGMRQRMNELHRL